MRDVFRKILSVSGLGVALCLLILTCAQASSQFLTNHYDGKKSFYQSERSLFRQARTALQTGDTASFKRLQQKIPDYPLSRYLAYEFIKHQFSESADKNGLARIERFRKQFDDEHLSARLVGHLLSDLVKQQRWVDYLQVAKQTSRSADQCSALLARVNSGSLKKFDKTAHALWIKPRKHPEDCVSAFTILEQNDPISVALVWKRINGLMDKGRVEEMESMLSYLGSRDRSQIQSWIEAWPDPAKALTKQDAFKKDSGLNRRIILNLGTKWAKRDSQASYDFWKVARDRYVFSRQQKYNLDALIARMGAYDGIEDADRWLHDLPDDMIDQKIRYWRIRTSLRQQSWDAVLQDIDALPEKERKDSQWRYWYARAHEKLGHSEEAKNLYRSIAGDMSYHGFLAADRIGVPYALRDATSSAENARLQKLSGNPAFIRAREYAFAGLPWEGRREWMKEVSSLSDDDKFAAAALAKDWEWADRAVFTVAKTGKKDALTLRFPMPHFDEVEKASSVHAIDSAWIFGVMRRESGFITDIRSGAGAVGLMQLMPATAKDVAKRQGRKHAGDLTLAENNIGLGSFYLRYVLNTFDNNQILATAAYNAGPSRVKRWLPVHDVLPADIWIDTIPYTETRRYVRAVTAYTAIFEWRQSKSVTPLHKRMIDIAPEPVLLTKR